MLEGEIVDSQPNSAPGETERLRAAVDRLTRERDALREENTDLQRRVAEDTAPLARLRKVLEPLYRALQSVFNELESVAPAPDVAQAVPVSNHVAAAWEEWKTKLGGACASIITALQKHGSANYSQLMILIGVKRRQTVYDAILKLNKSGLIDKNGDRFSLKEL
jgi:chromosome segregation ATPase